jgi:hypothetical protein
MQTSPEHSEPWRRRCVCIQLRSARCRSIPHAGGTDRYAGGKIQDIGERIQDVGETIQHSDGKIQSPDKRIQDAGASIQDTGKKIQDTGGKIQDIGERIQEPGGGDAHTFQTIRYIGGSNASAVTGDASAAGKIGTPATPSRVLAETFSPSAAPVHAQVNPFRPLAAAARPLSRPIRKESVGFCSRPAAMGVLPEDSARCRADFLCESSGSRMEIRNAAIYMESNREPLNVSGFGQSATRRCAPKRTL